MELDDVTNLIVELDDESIASVVQSKLDAGADPQDLLKALTSGMDEVGRR